MIFWNKLIASLRAIFHKHRWHQVTMTFERYPDGFIGDTARAKLYYDGNIIDEASISEDIGDYSLAVWFNPKNNLPYIGITKDKEEIR